MRLDINLRFEIEVLKFEIRFKIRENLGVTGKKNPKFLQMYEKLGLLAEEAELPTLAPEAL